VLDQQQQHRPATGVAIVTVWRQAERKKAVRQESTVERNWGNFRLDDSIMALPWI
jgi:hypothetical protein